MAEIDPVNARIKPGVETVTWTTLTENDTAESYIPGSMKSLAGSIQVTGTFGGGTIIFEGSNDNTNFVALDDVNGDPISFTSAGAAEFSTAMAYIRPRASVAGTSRDVDVIVSLRE